MTARLFAAAVLLVFGANVRSAAGQSSTPARDASLRLTVGLAVDTSDATLRSVLTLWRSYLAARPYTYEPKTQWSRVEQRRWPIFDLAMPAVYTTAAEYEQTRAIVLSIEPARPEGAGEFVIRTLFTRLDSARGRELPVAVTRVYALHENGAWVLANALTRVTADWQQAIVGPITYIYPGKHRFDVVKARYAVRFMDSVATAFGAPHPKHVTYYLARSPEEAFRISGLDFVPAGSTARTFPGNYMIFSGLPRYGEFYPHELTHLILGWILPALGTPEVLEEGLASWLGGSKGKSWSQLRAELAAAVRTDSSLTLGSLLAERSSSNSLRATAVGALLQLANDRGGIAAVKHVLSPPRVQHEPDVMLGAERALSLSRAALEAAWRQELLQR